MTDTKLHNYFIAAGIIIFVDDEATFAQRVDSNALIINDDPVFNLKAVGRIQQALQVQFLQKMQGNPNNPKIMDVIITNLVPLGRMTEEDFRAGTEEAELKAQAEGAFNGTRSKASEVLSSDTGGNDGSVETGTGVSGSAGEAEAGASEGLTS